MDMASILPTCTPPRRSTTRVISTIFDDHLTAVMVVAVVMAVVKLATLRFSEDCLKPMAVMDMAALHFSEEEPQAALNARFEHQELGAYMMDASRFVDAIFESSTSDRSGWSLGS